MTARSTRDELTLARAVAAIDPARITTLLARLIRAESANPPGREHDVAVVLADHLTRHGLSASISEVRPGRPNLSVTIGADGGRHLLLNAHTDTMPIGEGWTVPPLDGAIVDGMIYGRGACDAKGGLAAMVEALTVLSETVRLRGRVTLDAVIDEEGGAAGTRAFVAAGRSADWAIVAEPTDLHVARVSNGQLDVAVTIRGEAAHGSTPDDGVSAIGAAAELVGMIEAEHGRLRGYPHPLVGAASYSVGTIAGGIQASIVPDYCRVEVDRRILPGSTIGDAIAEFDGLLAALGARRPAVRLDRQVTVAIPPVDVPEDSSVCRALTGALRAEGLPPLVSGLRATSDAAWLVEAGIPAVVFGPGRLEHAHRPDERVRLADVVLAARVLVAAAIDLVG